MSNIISLIESKTNLIRSSFPEFKAGDTITVNLKIEEDNGKFRIQKFTGLVIQRRHPNSNGETFTVSKLVEDIRVERIFPIICPSISSIELVKQGVVRRARIFYMRSRRGKAAKVKEKKIKK